MLWFVLMRSLECDASLVDTSLWSMLSSLDRPALGLISKIAFL